MSDSSSEHNGRIFISYRRQDSAYPAGWLYDRLAERFGADQVFKDVDSIELGDDFVETITNAVGSCDILLALIGQEWLDISSSDGTRRLDDPDDFVRLEIEAALERKVLLIPILVEGALMPRGDQLPPSIAPMVRRQALELSPEPVPRRHRAPARRHGAHPRRHPGRARTHGGRRLRSRPRPRWRPRLRHRPSNPRPSRSRMSLNPSTTARSHGGWCWPGSPPRLSSPAVIVGIVNLIGDDPKKDPDSVDFSSPPAAATAPPKLGGLRRTDRAWPTAAATRSMPGRRFQRSSTRPASAHRSRPTCAGRRTALPYSCTTLVTTPGMECEGRNYGRRDGLVRPR